ncbi:MAG: hypothetical protein K2L51_06065 [Clostridiales bacterium]|nr:hypothetical protein [Clostridiales bacterium]
MKNRVQLVTVAAVTFALTAVLGLLPYVFFIPLLFTCVTRGWRMTVLESLFFGILSLVYAYAMPASFVAVAFTKNPWIPIVPRLLAGLGCHGTYVLLRRCIKGDSKAAQVVPVIVACAVGSLLNTALVVPCLVWRGGSLFGNYELTAALLVGQTLISGAIELAVSVTVVPTLAVTVGRALRLPDYVKKTKPLEAPAAKE